MKARKNLILEPFSICIHECITAKIFKKSINDIISHHSNLLYILCIKCLGGRGMWATQGHTGVVFCDRVNPQGLWEAGFVVSKGEVLPGSHGACRLLVRTVLQAGRESTRQDKQELHLVNLRRSTVD